MSHCTQVHEDIWMRILAGRHIRYRSVLSMSRTILNNIRSSWGQDSERLSGTTTSKQQQIVTHSFPFQHEAFYVRDTARCSSKVSENGETSWEILNTAAVRRIVTLCKGHFLETITYLLDRPPRESICNLRTSIPGFLLLSAGTLSNLYVDSNEQHQANTRLITWQCSYLSLINPPWQAKI